MRAFAGLLMACVLVCAGCDKPIDLTTGLQVQNVTTGWFDAGIVNGQNKLVPAISFTLKNLSDQKLIALQVNALFRRVTEKDEWGSGFLTVTGSQGLAPDAMTAPLVIRSQLGYTGSDQSREDMLGNSHFVDAEVERFRTASRQRGAAPVVAALRARLESLRVAELERHRAQLADLSEEEWDQVDQSTRAALAKMLHEPTMLLKETAGTPRGERLVEALRILFDL